MPSVYIQSSVFLPTPSGGAGAVELLVAKMAEGLAKRGWDVTLFGLEGSQVEGVDNIVTPVGIRYANPAHTEKQFVEQMYRLLERTAAQPDVIFDHSLHMFAGQRRGPYVAMSHGMAPLPSWAHNVVFTSQHHGRLHGRKDPQALLLGIDLADIPQATAEKRQGLFWAGRIMPYKRLHLACEIARLAGMPLRVAGPIVDEMYFRQVLKTSVTGPLGESSMKYLGELPHAEVLAEMARAEALLFTSDASEPAGLVVLEAMGCDTPVVALAGNAATEYVNGATTETGGGFVCEGVDVASVFAQNPSPCSPRQHVESRFKISDMVDRAEEYLRRAIAGERW